MKKAFAVILAVLLCLSILSGCKEVEQKSFDIYGGNPPAEAASNQSVPVEEADDLPEGTYIWDGMTFAYSGVSEDMSDLAPELTAPDGKWVSAVFNILDGSMEISQLESMILEQHMIRLDDYLPFTILEEGISIENDLAYAVGTIHVYFDVPADYDISAANVIVEGSEPSATANTSPEAAAEPGTVEGITALSGVIYKPGEGEMAYCPSDADGYFAVDGTLNAQSTIGICVDPNGILNFDLELATDTEMSVDAEIRVYKDGTALASYSEGGLVLPAGSTVITACVNTKEAEPCSGEYTVEFYINGTLVISTTDPICDAV